MLHYWRRLARRIRLLFLHRHRRREEKTPLTLHECLDDDSSRFRNNQKLYIFIILLIPIFFMFYYKDNSRSRRISYPLRIPKKADEVVLEKNSLLYMFNYTKYSHESPYKERVTETVTVAAAVVVTKPPVTEKNDSSMMAGMDTQEREALPYCVLTHTGNVTVHKVRVRLNTTRLDSEVLIGGYYSPSGCRPRHKVGILVPYRNREKELSIFLYNIHPFLIRQKLEYRIFVVEQLGKDPFNRGRVLNAGFKELLKISKWNCVVFHDVDLVPLDDRIMYTCPAVPRHMCVSVVDEEKNITSRTLFGGVSSMSMKHFKEVNGFSNLYWGLGGEDNDLFWRMKATGRGVVRLNKKVAKYMSLSHGSRPLNPYRFHLLTTATERFKHDGLSDLNYTIVSYHLRHLYTHIIVDINPTHKNITNEILGIV